MNIEVRFLDKVKRAHRRCWLWMACRNRAGYGKFGVGRKTILSHRMSWELWRGPIPAASQVLHRCDNPPCVNPAHLFLGTALDNIRDMIAKGRRGYTGHVGERNCKAKLSESDVRKIRSRFKRGESRAEIAESLRLKWNMVDRIVRRLYWRHI